MDHCWRGRVGRFRFGYLTVVILVRLCSQSKNFEFRIAKFLFQPDQFEIRNPTFGLVDLARFERATSTFEESRSNSPELQIQCRDEG